MLKTTLKVLPAALLLAACAQTQDKQDRLGELNIQPMQEVRHSYDQARAQYQLGRYYHGQLRFQQAEQAYRQALATEPGMVDAWNALGAVYAETGDLPHARAMFEQALKHDPQSSYSYNNLGYVHYLEGDNETAAAAFKQALRLEGGSQKARQNLVLVYSRMGKEEQIARTDSPATASPATASPATASLVTAAADPAPATQATTVVQAQAANWVQVASSIYEVSPRPEATLHKATIAPLNVADNASPIAAPAELATPAAPAVSPVAPAVSPAAPAIPPVAPAVSPAPPAVSIATAPAAGASAPQTPAGTAMPAPTLTQSYAQPKMINVALRTAVTLAPASDYALRRGGTEVSNGNGVRGFAFRMSRYFSNFGISKTRLTNQKPFVERQTRIEYRPGNEAEAAQLNALLPKAVPHVASTQLRSDIRVRLVLGHDIRREVTVWEDKLNGALKLAMTPAGLQLPKI